ncbi:Photosynthetic NDH subunit of subcomplex B 4, chloroplastic [Sesamum alatum]|uniref:Photosynthetic NDH subunit of subcomplex B 4, chloroplastic n=1 Tax=Sesamum alatum TaxID=300844 RepID=A0AAE1YVT7_9LAMI|nr:Photosynthetic NDH subunit of subcomplex B 4, chloroplastic [Sesamum alatum]
MAETITTFTLLKPTPKPHYFSSFSKSLKQCSSASRFSLGGHQIEDGRSCSRASRVVKVKALPDWPLMAVMVEHMEGQRDLITHKSIWHLSDEAMKNVYTFYIMFTCWGCCFFGSTKDPYYDSEAYRKDGGDGTGHWVYEKQEDIEESARAELWREELIEEIEQKVGGLRELEEAGKKEEVLK